MRKLSKSRKLFDEESGEIYNKLITNKNFKSLSILEIFSIAMVMGKKRGRPEPLKKNRVAEVNKYTMDNSKSFNYLLMALGVEEEGSIDILSDEVKYFEIAEQYAKNGLELIEQDLKNNVEILDEMEMELLEVYDSLFD